VVIKAITTTTTLVTELKTIRQRQVHSITILAIRGVISTRTTIAVVVVVAKTITTATTIIITMEIILIKITLIVILMQIILKLNHSNHSIQDQS